MKLTSENYVTIFTMGYLSACKDFHDYGENQKDVIRTPDAKIKIGNMGVDWIKKQEENNKVIPIKEGNNGQKKEG